MAPGRPVGLQSAPEVPRRPLPEAHLRDGERVRGQGRERDAQGEGYS